MRKHFFNLLIGLSFMLASLAGQAQVGTEQQLKAAYLVNFLKYVEWPETPAKATICLFGREAMANALAHYEGRSIAGRPIELRHVSGPDQLAGCQILYVPDTEEARFAAVLRWTEGLPILTVSDAEFFARQGGGVALVREDTRLRFDVNLDALNRVKLKPASQMLRLARQVIGGAR